MANFIIQRESTACSLCSVYFFFKLLSWKKLYIHDYEKRLSGKYISVLPFLYPSFSLFFLLVPARKSSGLHLVAQDASYRLPKSFIQRLFVEDCSAWVTEVDCITE